MNAAGAPRCRRIDRTWRRLVLWIAMGLPAPLLAPNVEAAAPVVIERDVAVAGVAVSLYAS
jgi:hypothetical protein